jgi:hypothetical protein
MAYEILMEFKHVSDRESKLMFWLLVVVGLPLAWLLALWYWSLNKQRALI